MSAGMTAYVGWIGFLNRYPREGGFFWEVQLHHPERPAVPPDLASRIRGGGVLTGIHGQACRQANESSGTRCPKNMSTR